MNIATDYAFNLDRVDALVRDDPILPWLPVLKSVRMSPREQVYFRRGMWGCLERVLRDIDAVLAESTGRVFVRLSTISAKDVDVPWGGRAREILKGMLKSERVQVDMDEAIDRRAGMSFVLRPWVEFREEYRTFMRDNEWHGTRSTQGCPLPRHHPIVQMGTRLSSIIGGGAFVYDVGENTTGELLLIELNQWDDGTDEYMPTVYDRTSNWHRPASTADLEPDDVLCHVGEALEPNQAITGCSRL